MRKNSARKLLHAILDLVPVILIPVFMIYSHRHNVTVETNAEIEYKYQSNEVNTIDDIQVDNIYLWSDIINVSKLTYTSSALSFSFYGATEIYGFYQTSIDEFLLDEVNNFDTKYWIYFIDNSNEYNLFIYGNEDEDKYISFNCEYEDEFNFTNMIVSFNEYDLELFKELYTDNPNAWNLPQYCPYNVIESVAIDTSNNTIGKAFLNDFNETISQYFDFGNAFNFQSIWAWIRTNIFNNHVSQIMYSIWCIVCYEFLVDLLFIFYSFFMFLIDFCEYLLEKPFNKINRGK